ncbi:MAG: transposase [bacterium]|nr:transposase [bacterium]
MAENERHQPEKALLHRVIREQLETFLSKAREQGSPVARFVEREIRAYLDCGVLANGFLRVHCDGCGHDRLVAFSCKGRGFCPSCGGRRMADTAAHLVDRVLPVVPIRQWVLTLPYPLRHPCAWDAELTSAVLRTFLRTLFADQRRRARNLHGVRGGHCAAVTFIQRFGSALNLTPHFHSLVLDGIYTGPAHAPGPFLPLPPPETEDVARVMAGTARRILRLLEHRNLEYGNPSPAEDDPLLATLMAASIRSRIATGPEAGQPWRRQGDRVEPADGDVTATAPPRCVREGGMSLHADVAVPARDRKRLERLCRYVARPPIAQNRLEALPDGRLAYRLKTRWRDGTTHVLMERHELLERLAPLIPPPRAHQVRYHGLLAPCASGRDRIVPEASVCERTEADPPAAQINRGKDAPLRTESPDPGQAPTDAQHSTEHAPSSGSLSSGLEPPAIGDHAHGCGEDPSRCTAPTPPRSDPRVTLSRPARRLPWADLLQRIFEVDALCCPHCGGRMRILAAITEADVARRILACLALPTRAPPVAPSRPSVFPESWTNGDDALGREDAIGSDFEFDQSVPAAWDSGA